ncbi:MAG: T9SS type A sorting domain-containing protein [Vicingaceae bacterium]|nr:T9SS type A sorting domain-containing protein [Vicingaceae bacterium]
MKYFIALFFLFSSLFISAQDTLTIMAYNVLNYPASNFSKADTLKPIIKHVQPDIFLITELTSFSGVGLILNNALNVDGVTHYQNATYFDGPDTDNMLFYNSNKLELYSQYEISTSLRNISEYILFYKSPGLGPGDDTIFIHCYMAHLKASQGASNEQQRNQEAVVFKNYLDNKAATLENVIFGGDMNIYGDYEAAYNTIINGGSVNLYDPINASGLWHDNAFFADIHTQSPRTALLPDGGSIGGMDDRFDWIFVSDDVRNGTNHLQYIPNSYYALGNDGNHFNQSILAAPTNTSVPNNVLQALHFMSDHLPVIMKTEIGYNVSIKEVATQPWEGYFANQHFHFSSKNVEETLSVEIYDLLGKLIQTAQFNNQHQFQLAINENIKGVFILKITSNNTQQSFKLLAQ